MSKRVAAVVVGRPLLGEITIPILSVINTAGLLVDAGSALNKVSYEIKEGSKVEVGSLHRVTYNNVVVLVCGCHCDWSRLSLLRKVESKRRRILGNRTNLGKGDSYICRQTMQGALINDVRHGPSRPS